MRALDRLPRFNRTQLVLRLQCRCGYESGARILSQNGMDCNSFFRLIERSLAIEGITQYGAIE